MLSTSRDITQQDTHHESTAPNHVVFEKSYDIFWGDSYRVRPKTYHFECNPESGAMRVVHCHQRLCMVIGFTNTKQCKPMMINGLDISSKDC